MLSEEVTTGQRADGQVGEGQEGQPGVKALHWEGADIPGADRSPLRMDDQRREHGRPVLDKAQKA